MDFKKIIAFLCVLSICFSFCVPAFADLGNGQFEVTDIWDWFHRNVGSVLNDYLVTHRFYDSGCSESVSGYHSWACRNLDEYYCTECGLLFRYYDVAPGYWDEAYDSYVSELPVDSITDQGWYTDGNYLYLYWTLPISFSGGTYIHSSSITSGSSATEETLICSSSTFHTNFHENRYIKTISINCDPISLPFDGYYKRIESTCVKCNNASYTHNFFGTSFRSYSAGQTFNPTIAFSSNSENYASGALGSVEIDLIRLPLSTNPESDFSDNYTPESRFTNYTFNLGTVYNGDVTNVYNNQKIINETNMTLTNPSTGTTYNITYWIYNYTDRSVSGETEDGDTYNVQFGDQYLIVSIDEDDYYYYYVIEQQVCDHHYVITDQTPPSCTASGSVTYTCSECGDTYTDTVPALGHNYQFVQSVPASGEDPGYDLFRCTRCGDEYTDSTFFNDDSDDANYWAWLKTWLQSFWNWLGNKLDAILDKDTTVNVDQDVNIDLPDVNIDFQYVDEAGEQQTWNPGELRSKFAFWKDVRDIGIELYDSVQPTAVRNGAYNPPELIIHLSAAESNYGVTYGGDEYAMDLSWYEPYKSTVDGIAGGFLWLLYLYGVWKHLPDIFSGAGMLENRMTDLQAGERHSRRRERD